MVGIQLAKEPVRANLDGPVETEPCLGYPTTPTDCVIYTDAVHGVDPRAIVINENTGNGSKWPTTVIGRGETAVGCQQYVSPHVKMIVATDGALRARKKSHYGIRRGRLIRQRNSIQRKLVSRDCIQQLRAQCLSENVALNKGAFHLPVPLIVAEDEDLVLFDRSAQ